MISQAKVKKSLAAVICLALVLGLWPLALQTAQADDGDSLSSRPSEPSGGSYMLRQLTAGVALGPYSGQDDVQSPASPGIGTTFDGFNFDDNSTENAGWVFIPADPIGAAGTDRLIAVVNKMIEARSKTGTLLWRDALKDFFNTLTPANFLFDPKVVYDHYENRFLVVALERVDAGANPNPGNTSRILLAVSKTATPATATAADWYYTAINSEESISGVDYWADYPGFEVDEQAVYITNNIFAHTPVSDYGGSRLWIVDKGVVGGFYAGGVATVTKHDPYALSGSPYAATTMPTQVYGIGGIDGGGSGGTYLVSYSGLTDGGALASEYVQVILVDNPLGAATFTQEYVDVGDIEDVGGVYGWPALPDAPQLGIATLIEVNDSRALDAVWRNNRLWLTTTINPNAGPDGGQTTAHWFRLDTTAWPPTLDDQGNIGGEDIATGTYTYFPSLAVNNNGDAKFGFSASAPTIYAGAYATVHLAGDPPGTVQASETVRAGVDWYVRTLSGTDNRWGDYTGAALDPTDDNVVWLFNKYAMLRGSLSDGEDGRWGTTWASNLFTVVAAQPSVTTNNASNITSTSATLNGNLSSLGTASTVFVSFEYGLTTAYGNETTVQAMTTTGPFSFNLSALSPNTTYHFRGKAVGNGTSYGLDKGFSTLPAVVPPATTATRDIANQTLAPGEDTNVTVTINNAQLQALGLDEDPPAGWPVAEVDNEGGAYQATLIEWAWVPLAEAGTITVIYSLTVPVGSPEGIYEISGTLITSEGVVAVGGDSTITVGLGILVYYRGLGSDPNVVELSDLVQAGNDWLSGQAPPGFTTPITLSQLVQLANEWLGV